MSDLVPNAGITFDEPDEERVEQEQAEREFVTKSFPVFEHVMEALEVRIQALDSVSALGVDINDDPMVHQRKMFAVQLAIDVLTREKEELTAIFESFKPQAQE